MSDASLMKYFKFDETDLSANRNGVLSQRQKGCLMGERRSFKSKARIVGIIVGAGSLVMLSGILWAGLLNGSRVLLFVIPMLFIMPLGLAGFLIFGKFGDGNFTVKKIEGPIDLRMTQSYNKDGTINQHYRLKIGDQSFVVDQDLSSVMTDGEMYKVYYADDWSEILSAERV